MTGKRGYIVIDEAGNIPRALIEEFAKGDPDELRKQYTGEFEPEPGPPDVLSLDPNSPDFHPCYVRVGLRIDGVERNDIAYYNVKNRSYKTARDTSHLAETIEPYWRYQPSRQQRRAEERWRPRK